jgi:hypothetical protein
MAGIGKATSQAEYQLECGTGVPPGFTHRVRVPRLSKKPGALEYQ